MPEIKWLTAVYFLVDPKPYIDGTRINSPHYLCQMTVTEASSYTLVVAQYEKTTTIHYTIRVYASCPFTITKIVDNYKHSKTVGLEWVRRVFIKRFLNLVLVLYIFMPFPVRKLQRSL